MLLSWEGQRKSSEIFLSPKSSRTKLECHFLILVPAARALLFVMLHTSALKALFGVLNMRSYRTCRHGDVT